VAREALAEWLTVVAGGVYIPVELYELWRGVTGRSLGLLAVNIAIVVYLVRVLYRAKHAPT